MGLYISFEDVRVRLIGKVRFTDLEDDDSGRMHISLANRLIAEAEGQVEYDLSPRYSAPFETVDGQPFANLPERPTKNFLRTMCELKSVIRILETDFGSGSAVDGESYMKNLVKRYEEMLAQLTERKKDGGGIGQGFQFPPLPGLRLNYMNEEADDGFMGTVLVTTEGDGDYPAKQINNPGKNFFNRW